MHKYVSCFLSDTLVGKEMGLLSARIFICWWVVRNMKKYLAFHLGCVNKTIGLICIILGGYFIENVMLYSNLNSNFKICLILAGISTNILVHKVEVAGFDKPYPYITKDFSSGCSPIHWPFRYVSQN